MEKYKFWTVMEDDSSDIVCKRNDKGDAITEAKIAAMNNPGKHFFVLETVKCLAIETPPIEVELHDLPF